MYAGDFFLYGIRILFYPKPVTCLHPPPSVSSILLCCLQGMSRGKLDVNECDYSGRFVWQYMSVMLPDGKQVFDRLWELEPRLDLVWASFARMTLSLADTEYLQGVEYLWQGTASDTAAHKDWVQEGRWRHSLRRARIGAT